MKASKLKILGAAALTLALCAAAAGCSSNVTNVNSYTFSIDENGYLIATNSDGSSQNIGKVTGENGKDGINGSDGKDGEDGKDGANGSDGKDGEDGKDGANGSDGKDGKDGAGVDVVAAYEKYLEEYGEDSMTYAEFLKEFFGVSTGNTSVVSDCLLSSMKVYSEFRYNYTQNTGSWMRPSFTNVKSVGHTQGSAVIYKMGKDYSYVLTNYHVVYYSGANSDNNGGSKIANKIYCYLYGSESQPRAVVNSAGNNYETDEDGYVKYDYDSCGILCEYVGGSMGADIAVLRVPTAEILKINSKARAVTLANDYCVGQQAIAVGNTEGKGISVTEGIISVDSEIINYDINDDNRINDFEYYRCLRIDTAIYSGNSGGGLFDGEGKLIGITNAGDNSDQNINYAIPLSIVTGAANNIIYYYEDGNPETNGVNKLILGINTNSKNSKYVYDAASGRGQIIEEIVITSVDANSVASKMGLEAGDIITAVSVNGKAYTISRGFNISDVLYTVREGDTVVIAYSRGGATAKTNGFFVRASDLIPQV